MIFSNDAPSADEIEVSVFGKGLGEAIVVHLGDGRWVAIDSIALQGRSVSEMYLSAIGVDVENQLDLIVATHWHDDHVMGISHLFKAAKCAELAISSAMLKNEFAKFLAAFTGQIGKKFSSGVEEIGKLIEIACKRKNSDSKWPVIHVGPGQCLWRRSVDQLGHKRAVSLEALSPSSYDQSLFLSRIGGAEPNPRVLQRARLPSQNDVSVALHLTIGQHAVLFGADLETRTEPNSGWDAVLNSSVLPQTRATLIKIPHHGSKTGHHPEMWTKLAMPKPIATMTPWQRVFLRELI